MKWCSEGSSTYQKRKELFEHQKELVEAEISKLEKVLDMLRFKCWYYERAMKDGNENWIQEHLPDRLPEDIQKLYNNAMKEE